MYQAAWWYRAMTSAKATQTTTAAGRQANPSRAASSRAARSTPRTALAIPPFICVPSPRPRDPSRAYPIPRPLGKAVRGRDAPDTAAETAALHLTGLFSVAQAPSPVQRQRTPWAGCPGYTRRCVELFFKWTKQHPRINASYGTNENAVKPQVWIAIAAYVLVAIVKKQLNIERSLYTMLQSLSVTLFEKTPILQAFSDEQDCEIDTENPNPLILFD